MAKSLERITLLVPILVVTGITLAATLVVLSRAHQASPAKEVLADIAASSEKTPVDAKAMANLLANVQGVTSVSIAGGAQTGVSVPHAALTFLSMPSAPLEEICATLQTTTGPTMLCANTRAVQTSIAPIATVAISAIAASLLAAVITTRLARRASRAAIDASAAVLLEQVNEKEVALRRRTLELESANKELEAFTFSASHDLRAPLASIDGFTQMMIEDSNLDDMARDCVHWIRDACLQMQELVDGLLQMSHFSRADIDREEVDLSTIARTVADGLRQREPERDVEFRIEDSIVVNGDRRLLRAVLENLMSNAWKFTRKHPHARIEIGATQENGRRAIYVRDDGAGFDPGYAAKMFRAFQRLHSRQEFEGTGIGLATVERIVHRHGGRIWAEGEVEKGATFYFVV
jgi:signal transduction histidine kinase